MTPESEGGSDRSPGRPAVGRHRALSERLRRARIAHFGAEGVADLSRRLGVPERTWRNYETGVSLPADVVLRFMELTGVTARELLRDGSPVADGYGGVEGAVLGRDSLGVQSGGTGPCEGWPPSSSLPVLGPMGSNSPEKARDWRLREWRALYDRPVSGLPRTGRLRSPRPALADPISTGPRREDASGPPRSPGLIQEEDSHEP